MIIYEVLIEDRGRSLSEVAAQVAASMGIRVASTQGDPREVALTYEVPLIVTTADYDDEGPTMMVGRYNYTTYSWDLAAAERAYDAIAAATDWPIALFNEELYQITRQRDPLAISA